MRSLLDTYETERKPHARFWVEQAATAAGFLQTTDAEVAKQRDEFIRTNPAASAPVSPALGPGLHEGDTDKRAGHLGIQPILADGVRLDDMVGAHFLVATSRDLYDAVPAELRAQLEEDGDVVVLLDPGQGRPDPRKRRAPPPSSCGRTATSWVSPTRPKARAPRAQHPHRRPRRTGAPLDQHPPKSAQD